MGSLKDTLIRIIKKLEEQNKPTSGATTALEMREKQGPGFQWADIGLEDNPPEQKKDESEEKKVKKPPIIKKQHYLKGNPMKHDVGF